MTQIKRIYDGTVLFSHDSVSVKETLLAAIAAGADLRSADLRGANLRCVDLQGVDLRCANLRGAKGLDTFIIAAEGILIGYKKLANGKIAMLRIPAKAKRVNAYG